MGTIYARMRRAELGKGLGRLIPTHPTHPTERRSPRDAVEEAKAIKARAFVVTCPNCKAGKPAKPVLRAYRVNGNWAMEAHQKWLIGWRWVPMWLHELGENETVDVAHCGQENDLSKNWLLDKTKSGPRRIPADAP